MRRIDLIFVFALWAFSVFGNEINLAWETPDISSNNYSSILEEKTEPIEIAYQSVKLKQDSKSYFALQNWPAFKSALKEYLTSSNSQNSFLSLNEKIYNANILLEPLEIFPGHTKQFRKLEEPVSYGFDFNLKTGFDYKVHRDESYNFTYLGFNLNGYIQDKLFFYTNFWSGQFSGDLDYIEQSNLIDSWIQPSDDSTQVYLDNVSGKLLYQIKPFWSVALGRGKYEIGNNIGGSIILNDACNDYGYFATKFDFSKFYVHFLHASLLADSTLTGYKDYPDKYLAVHKFGWKPNRNLEIFWGEHVVYGARNIDPSYLIPFNYWRGTEHNLSDRDNILIFAGFNLRPFKRDLFYTNMIVDELSFSKILGNWWGNKYAIQIGNSYQFNENNKNRITLEFTAIRPWLYTHKFIQNKFSNDDVGLGFPMGSNLLNYALEINWEIRRNLICNLHTSITRQGSVGNDFSINYEPIDPELENDTHWLEGDIINYQKARLVVDWKPLTHHRFRISIGMEKVDDNEFSNELMLSYQTIF